MQSSLVGVMAVAVGFGVVLGIGFWWQPGSEWGVERWWRGRSARPSGAHCLRGEFGYDGDV